MANQNDIITPQQIVLCQICHKPHDGKYGSGRFCSKECSNKSRQINRRKTLLINRKLGIKSKNFKPTQSKLQRRIVKTIKKLGYPVQTQVRVGKYYFDFKVGNVLFQVNGDFWHANPKMYKPNSVINYPGGKKKLAANIWKKDLKKRQIAMSQGYKVVYLWETDLKKLTQNQLLLYVKKQLLME